MMKIPDYFRSHWHLVALSKDVRPNKVIARTVVGTRIAIFRSNSGISALLDRCPHRNYPLSQGRVVADTIECAYHGWRFMGDGKCVGVPGCAFGLLDENITEKLKAEKVHVVEKGGGIFVRLSEEGDEFPELPELFGDTNYDHFWWKQGVWKGSSFDAIENVLDPFHTKFIHHGFIRTRHKHMPVQLQVNSWERSIEMVIQQKQPDYGIMSKFLELGGRDYSSTRYYPPTTVQARWKGKKKLTLCVTAFFTCVDESSFRPFAYFTTPKGYTPAWLKQALIRGFLFPVVAQDKRALAYQHEVAESFGAPRYTQGPGDLLGSRVHKLYVNKKLEPGQDSPVDAEL